MGLEEDLIAIEAGYGVLAFEARDRLVERGAEVVEPVMEAYRAGSIKGHMAFEILVLLGPAGREALERSLARDDAEGGEALTILARKAPVEAVPWILMGIRQEDPMKVLRSLVTFVETFPKLPPGEPGEAAREQMRTAGPELFHRLDSEDTRHGLQAARCLAMAWISPEEAVSRLLAMTRNPAYWQETPTLAKCLGAFGDHARPALDWLVEQAEKRDSSAIVALEGLGAVAAPALPALERIKESYESDTKSDVKQFRSFITRVQKAIRKAEKERSAAVGAAEAEKTVDPLEDLFERVEGRDDSSFQVHSSAESASSQAKGELRALKEPALIEEVERRLGKRCSAARFRTLVDLLGAVTRNSGAERGRELLVELCRSEESHRSRLRSVHHQVVHARIEKASDVLLSQLRRGIDGELKVDFYPLIDFFSTFPDAPSIQLLGRLALEDSGFYGVQAARKLSGLRHPAVRPQLERLVVSEDLGYRKSRDLERRALAIFGLGRLGDPAAAEVVVAELRKNQPSTRETCLWTLAELDDAETTEAVAQGFRRALAQLRKQKRASSSRTPILVPTLRFLERHLGEKDPGSSSYGTS